MRTLFNDNWQFYELSLDEKSLYKDSKPVFFTPDDFFESSQNYEYQNIKVPHDYQIYHTKDLYKNSVGLYKKIFTLTKEQVQNFVAVRFESVYMNCGVWINGKKAFEWKYGYTAFESDLSEYVHEGENILQVICVYEHCNSRWYSGAGIIRDVTLICTNKTHLVTDGVYIVNRPVENAFNSSNSNSMHKWTCKISCEVAGIDGNGSEHTNAKNIKIKHTLLDMEGKIVASNGGPESLDLKNSTILEIENPVLWSPENPYYYICKTELFDSTGTKLDELEHHCGFKTIQFDCNKGFFLNGKHLKIQGVCQHHDLGSLGAAFDVNALRRQFIKLKEMGVNAIRTSHNPPPTAFMNLADEMGFLIVDELFDMWEKPKTPFDYGNYFNDWHFRDAMSWLKKDRNHPSLLLWSIGNEIYDTHVGNGLEITKNLCKIVRTFDSERNALITIASNYMMTDGAQECAKEIDLVGYNYLERLYDEHHKKYPKWNIYGSETSSTVQSRGIYHFPESLNLVTYDDGQCSTLGNCTVPWGAVNTQKVITFERDCNYSAGQFIWTGWDYIGEPTPYHTKNSYFGQIDTAGFPKDTFYLYKSEWAGKTGEVRNGKTFEPFVHLLPYWDWNEGQLIDVKAYTNASNVELFFNGKSLGLQKIDHEHAAEPFGRWQVAYHKGEIKAICYDDKGNPLAQDIKCSFEDPASIVLEPEVEKTGNLCFVDIMVSDKNGTLVENARNYITFNVTGKADLLGMDNGDSTDYDEYTPSDRQGHGNALSRKLFSNRLVAIIRYHGSFVITAASKDLPTVSKKFDGKTWTDVAPYYAIHAEKDYIPVRKIELTSEGDTNLGSKNKEITVKAKILPKNATCKEIKWTPVLKECVPSDFIKVGDVVSGQADDGTSFQSATISANGDGECILRVTAQNGSNLSEIISDLPFTVSGVGNPNLNPYKLIEGCRFTTWDGERKKTPITLESGISNRNIGPTWVAFDKVDFGVEGTDTIHIPIFSFATELPVEVWDGKPANGTTSEGAVARQGESCNDENCSFNSKNEVSECLGKFIYKHQSVYNTYNENVFTLSKRLFGIHTISIVLPQEVYFKGFYFDKTKKATAKLRALDAELISGDSFTKGKEVVEHIGNNVSLVFNNMDFSSSSDDDNKTATESQNLTLTICGKSNTENNTINVKFFTKDGANSTQVIEFAHTNDFEEKTFTLKPVANVQKVSFVFLPGSDFDFKWFRFS